MKPSFSISDNSIPDDSISAASEPGEPAGGAPSPLAATDGTDGPAEVAALKSSFSLSVAQCRALKNLMSGQSMTQAASGAGVWLQMTMSGPSRLFSPARLISRLSLASAGHSLLPSVRHHDVGTPENKVFEAQYPARIFPCQRFDDDLTIITAWLGADVARYAFVVWNFHSLHLTGFAGARWPFFFFPPITATVG
jgi:hypothetical protein